MALSSEDLVNWQLKTGMRGYLIPQVDELLDEVADELDRLHGRIRALEAEREAVQTSLDDQLEVEETLRRTLYQAQKAADQTIEDAGATAERLVADARAEAEALVASARERGQVAYDDALRAATEERAQVRASLEAEEARMRAVRSELRAEVDRLRVIESETRRLLRGLFEDRLNELERPGVELPSLADVPGASVGAADPDLPATPDRPSSWEVAEGSSTVDDEPAAKPVVGASASAAASPVSAPSAVDVVEADAPHDRPGDDRRDDQPSEDLVVVVESPSNRPGGTGTTVESAAEDLHDDLELDEVGGDRRPWSLSDQATSTVARAHDVDAGPVDDGATSRDAVGDDEAEGRPSYLGAVHDALAAIQANAEDDARGVSAPRDDADVDADGESLFESPPPRRRRRQG